MGVLRVSHYWAGECWALAETVSFINGEWQRLLGLAMVHLHTVLQFLAGFQNYWFINYLVEE